MAAWVAPLYGQGVTIILGQTVPKEDYPKYSVYIQMLFFPRQYDLNHLKKSNIVNKASSTTSRNTKPFQTLLKLSFYSYVSNKTAYHDLMMDLLFLPKQNSHFKYKKVNFLDYLQK